MLYGREIWQAPQTTTESISEMGILRLLNGPVIVKGQTVKQPNSLTDSLDKTTVVIEVVTTFSSFQVS
jgi:hypothetical protein